MTQTLIPHLWYDTQALEAAQTYTQVFANADIDWTHTLSDTPSGQAHLVQFHLGDLSLAAISAGPYFQLNESASLMVRLKDKAEVDRIYQALGHNGQDLMPLGQYPFSDYYVWFKDAFGLSWQLMLDPELSDKDYHIDTCLLFSMDQVGLADDFLSYYSTVFDSARIGHRSYYQAGQAPDQRAKLNYGELFIQDQRLVVMDHGYTGVAQFNEAFSFMVYVDTQKEADAYYQALSAVPQAEQCGWVKDKFGLSWQIVPRIIMEAYGKYSPQQLKAMNDAIMSMKRLDIEVITNLLKEK